MLISVHGLNLNHGFEINQFCEFGPLCQCMLCVCTFGRSSSVSTVVMRNDGYGEKKRTRKAAVI